MAKKKTRKPANQGGTRAKSEGSESASTASYSTRFDQRQRDLIEAAAKEKQWSPAQLIREAAVSRAADILNASGTQSFALRKLAKIVSEQLLAPGFERRNASGKWETVKYSPPSEDQHPDFEGDALPYEDDLPQIRQALKTCGMTFGRLILEAMDGVDSSGLRYSPAVDPSELLGGHSETRGDKRENPER
jgi:uncharacterized protein (DUF1778 family)